jgi:cell division protein FtsN
MENREAESGLELVFDNRRLIIVFALLIAICGCFFVVGFIEGKRQGFQDGSQTAGESAAKNSPDAEPAPASVPAASSEAPKSPPQDAADQPLNWYDSINRRGDAPTVGPPAALDSTPKSPLTPAAAVSTEKPRPPASAESGTYSVQVGAFRQKEEVEIQARSLREKGFDCRIEAPEEPGQLYLLKVGNFRTRAEAASMQLRLKKEGVNSFIKTN